MNIFLSYENKTHEEEAGLLASQLESNGFQLWFDKRHSRTLLRHIARSPSSDFGLDGWLRKGMYQSDAVIVIVTYYRRAKGVPESFGIYRPKTARELVNIAGEQIDILENAYRGKATSHWDGANSVDQFGHYMGHPIHTFRMVWYEVKVGVPLGKDPFEQWRRWEMRVAGYLKLKPFFVVTIEPDEDHLMDEVAGIFAQQENIIVLRRSRMEEDILNRLVPVLRQHPPSPTALQFTRQQARKVKHFENRLALRIGFIVAGILVAAALSALGLSKLHVYTVLIVLIIPVELALIIAGLLYFFPLIKE